ncbi:MAG TPA: Lrp/AsnC ligand binding domain-containing protein [Nitrososphaeraceae archaeon]|jgi:hypothetical protein
MINTYVLIVCDLGRTDLIASNIHDINGVSEVHIINGVYDIIVKMSVESQKDMDEAYSKIRLVNGIKTTVTLVAYTKD